MIRKVQYIFIFVDISYEIDKEELNEYFDNIERISSEQTQIIVIGSKSDKKKWRINKEDELEFLVENRFQYIELSSKDMSNCFAPFYQIALFQTTCQQQDNSSQSKCFIL